MSEVVEAIADASQNTAENTNISTSDFQMRRARQMEEQAAPPAPEPEAEEPSISEEVEAEAPPQEEEEVQGQTDVLSNIDLDNLSEAEIKQLSEALSSRAVDRFGQLTARAVSYTHLTLPTILRV